jgi:hypothetical protein
MHAESEQAEIEDLYQPSVALLDGWRKFLPTDATAIHWYDLPAFRIFPSGTSFASSAAWAAARQRS